MHKSFTGSDGRAAAPSDKARQARRRTGGEFGRLYHLPAATRPERAAARSPLPVRTAGANGAVSTPSCPADQPLEPEAASPHAAKPRDR